VPRIKYNNSDSNRLEQQEFGALHNNSNSNRLEQQEFGALEFARKTTTTGIQIAWSSRSLARSSSRATS